MYKITDNSKKFFNKNQEEMDRLFAQISSEIVQLSFFKVPKDKGYLQRSGTWTRNGMMDYVIKYRMPYARRWEFARENEPGVHFKNGRQSAYLRDSVKIALKNFDSKIKTVVARIKV